MRKIEPNVSCPYRRSRVQGSLECANCMYNRVGNIQLYASAARQEIKTAGSTCVADEYKTTKTKSKTK